MDDYFDLSDDVLDHTAEFEIADKMAAGIQFRKLLKDLDPRLDLILTKPNAIALPADRFVIVRRNDLAPTAYWAVHDGHGNFCVPDARHLDMMRKNDLSKRDVISDLKKAREVKQRAKEKARAAKSDEFREKLLERLNHVYDTSVRVPRAIPDA